MTVLRSPLRSVLRSPLYSPLVGKWGGGEAVPRVQLSATSIAESAEIGTIIGVLSVSNLGALTVSGYAITADPDSKFGIVADELVLDDAVDYETDTSHSVTIRATLSDASTVDRTFAITVTDVTELSPPTNVTWTSAASDTTPGFDLDLPVGAAADDVIRADVSDDGLNDWAEYFSYTLTSQDIIDDEITVSGITPLAEGDYDFRFRLERGAAVSGWTSIVNVTINAAPTISSLSPADNATGVALGADLVITFNKSVQFGTGTINLYDADDDLIESWNVATEVGGGAGQVSVSGAAVTCKATGNREGSKGHYVQIDATAIENLNDVAFAGIADKTTWSFTTTSAYTQNFVDSNGTAYASFTGPGTDAQGTWYFRFEPQAIGATGTLYSASGRTSITYNGTGNLVVIIRDSANSVVYSATSTSAEFSADVECRLYIAVDLAGPTISIKKNGSDVAMTVSTSLVAGSGLIAHNRTTGILTAGSGLGTALADIQICDWFFDATQVIAETSFHSGGAAIDLSSVGAPYVRLGGAQTADAMSGNTSQGWNDGHNLGSGGALTVGSATFTDA